MFSGFHEQDDAIAPIVVMLHAFILVMVVSPRPRFVAIFSKVFAQWMCERARCDMAAPDERERDTDTILLYNMCVSYF